MHAAILRDGTATMDVAEVWRDDPRPREVIVRTVAAGLCHSDYHLIDGVLVRPRPIILGHEASGVVIEVGSEVTSVAVGDHVVTCLVMGCGSCRPCGLGEPGFCLNPTATKRQPGDKPRITFKDGAPVGQMSAIGGLGSELIVDERALTKIPTTIPLTLAPLLGCAVVTGLGAVLKVAKVQPGETVAVIGCGGVGLNVIQAAQIAQAGRIIAIDVNDAKLQMATTFGATDLINSAADDAIAIVREITGGGVDHAFEVVGRESTVQQAFDLASPGRHAYALGIHPDDGRVTIATNGLRRGKSLVGVFMGDADPRVDIPRYVDLWATGQLGLESMVSHVLPLEQANEGFALMAAGESARTVITF